MRRRIWIALGLLAVAALGVRVLVVAQDLPEALTAAQFETVRADHPRLRAFLREMPKGGDLHTHLSGAVYAERYVAWAVRDGLCLRRSDWTILPRPPEAPAGQPCGADPAVTPLADAVAGGRGQTAYDLLINALSTRWFVSTPAVPSGHDQFFATFGKFNAATGGANWDSTAAAIAEMTFDQLKQYQADNAQYAEFMVTLLEGDDRRRLAQSIGTEFEPADMLAGLERGGLKEAVAKSAERMKDLVSRIELLRGCGLDTAKPGCNVTFRFIAQVNRNAGRAEVFAQTAHAAALVRAVPNIVVGLNYVGPEDYRVALRDYRTHMEWIAFLAGSDVPVALHAGELWLGLTPPTDLDFHIREAVEVAGARRIGHGTAIGFERAMDGLLAEMRTRGVAVEIALTSSDVILGVRGKEHPISTYLSAGVPVVLATDDAGVSRIDLTNEYYRAARDHGLSYQRLKHLAYNVIAHAFLREDQRAHQRAKLDAAFAGFEQATIEAQAPNDRFKLLMRALVPALP